MAGSFRYLVSPKGLPFHHSTRVGSGRLACFRRCMGGRKGQCASAPKRCSYPPSNPGTTERLNRIGRCVRGAGPCAYFVLPGIVSILHTSARSGRLQQRGAAGWGGPLAPPCQRPLLGQVPVQAPPPVKLPAGSCGPRMVLMPWLRELSTGMSSPLSEFGRQRQYRWS